MRGAIPPLPQYVFMVWSLLKPRDYFTFTIGLIGGEEEVHHKYESDEFCIHAGNLKESLNSRVH
jgi:hypothetical protein